MITNRCSNDEIWGGGRSHIAESVPYVSLSLRSHFAMIMHHDIIWIGLLEHGNRRPKPHNIEKLNAVEHDLVMA